MAACTPFPIFDSAVDEVNVSKHKKGYKTTTTKLILMKQHRIGAHFRGKPHFRSNRLTCKTRIMIYENCRLILFQFVMLTQQKVLKNVIIICMSVPCQKMCACFVLPH